MKLKPDTLREKKYTLRNTYKRLPLEFRHKYPKDLYVSIIDRLTKAFALDLIEDMTITIPSLGDEIYITEIRPDRSIVAGTKNRKLPIDWNETRKYLAYNPKDRHFIYHDVDTIYRIRRRKNINNKKALDYTHFKPLQSLRKLLKQKANAGEVIAFKDFTQS